MNKLFTILGSIILMFFIPLAFIVWLFVILAQTICGVDNVSFGYFLGVLFSDNKYYSLPKKRFPPETSEILKTDVAKWDLEYNELNELRFGVIRTLEEYCWYPGVMCVNCKMMKGCKLFFIHDAVKKTGIKQESWDAMRDWCTRYYQKHKRG